MQKGLNMAWFLRQSQLGLVSISGKWENQLRPIFARWHSKPFRTSNNERVLQTNCQTYIFVSSISFAFTYYFVNMYYVHNSRNITCKSAFFPFNQNDVTCHFPHNFQKELIWLYMEKRLTTINSRKCVSMRWNAMFQVQRNRADCKILLQSASSMYFNQVFQKCK